MALLTTGDPNRKKAMQDAQERMKQRRAAVATQETPIRDDVFAAGRENEIKPKKIKG
jgi:hypothetical protein